MLTCRAEIKFLKQKWFDNNVEPLKNYKFYFLRCVSAEPATLFIALELFGFERILDALDATDREVLSLFDRFITSINFG